MKVKIKVTFDMEFDPAGKSTTDVRFSLPDHPGTGCPDSVKPLVLGEIKMLCGAMGAAREELFSENGRGLPPGGAEVSETNEEGAKR